MPPSVHLANQPRITVCVLVSSPELAEQLTDVLTADRFHPPIVADSVQGFYSSVQAHRASLDCVVLDRRIKKADEAIAWLHRQAIVVPAVLLDETMPEPLIAQLSGSTDSDVQWLDSVRYHRSEVYVQPESILLIPDKIEQAIAAFLQLASCCCLDGTNDVGDGRPVNPHQHLSDKLKERLGYLGIYYKRDPQNFYRRLSAEERRSLRQELIRDYREIILSYFRPADDVNPKIDALVNKVFFADVSVSQVLEIHMELMEQFAKKLKLEGRNEEILLDYRLTLIDTIAHLCEMYRRSIPREP